MSMIIPRLVPACAAAALLAIAAPSAAPPSDAAPASADIDDGSRLPQRRRFALTLRGGAAYRDLFDTPISAAELQLGIGWETRGGAIYVALDGLLGQTEFGLGAR